LKTKRGKKKDIQNKKVREESRWNVLVGEGGGRGGWRPGEVGGGPPRQREEYETQEK